MLYQVKVRNPSSGEVEVVEVEADSKEEAQQLAREQIEEERREREKIAAAEEELIRAEAIRYAEKLARKAEKEARKAEAMAIRQAEDAARRFDEETREAEEKQKEAKEDRRAEEARRDKLTVGPRLWRYKMVQIPPNISIEEGQSKRGKAAGYLEEIVEEYAAYGWEFHRVDEIGVVVNQGCLGALFGAGPAHSSYFVVTFRCAVEAG